MTPEPTDERTPQRYYAPRGTPPRPIMLPVPPSPVSVPARPKAARPPGRLLRMFTHAFFFLIAAHVVTALADQTSAPGYRTVLRFLAPGSYLPLAVALSAALHAQRGIMIILVGLIMIGIWPFTINDLARWLVPVGAGIILGSLLEIVIRESHGEAP